MRQQHLCSLLTRRRGKYNSCKLSSAIKIAVKLRLQAWHLHYVRVTILVNWVLSRILSYDILFLGSNLKTIYFVLKVTIPSDRGWNYESNSVKKIIFDQKSSYDSCKLSQRYGIQGELLLWLKQFFTGRVYCTKVGLSFSDFVQLLSNTRQCYRT